MTVSEFIAKWTQAELRERAGFQEHFIDVCRLVGHPTPAEADPRGRFFAFDRGATKATGGQGWADVWKQRYFGWEHKGKAADLNAAYAQLLLYEGALENPPLLVVSDMVRIVIHTHFPKTPTEVYELSLDGLADDANFSDAMRSRRLARPSFHGDRIIEAIAERL